MDFERRNMERTADIKIVDFGSLRALVSVQIGDMEIRGFKVIDQGDGKRWVAPPSREIYRDGKKEYYNIARFTNDEAKDTFQDWILAEYDKERNGDRE